MEISQKLKIELSYDPEISLSCIYPKGGGNLKTKTNLKRYTCPNVHCSTMYNSQDMDAA